MSVRYEVGLLVGWIQHHLKPLHVVQGIAADLQSNKVLMKAVCASVQDTSAADTKG